ncbi:hypothetical protein C3486_22800 [Streptomyces sp. Ru73]|uniref:acyl carrier protein n=1 Tax=Streptomyces sp. Ru73 TaxID=2080748 RepID=UPI000CDCF90F|nr:acyl carrier protein [Streptomyces sp. Ru73]POX38555.1 hypothetical protein C3486_22800 [Streptomyces sp. Ru73]
MTTTVGREAIEKFVTDALAGLGVDREAITPGAMLDDLEVDSLDLLELCQSIKLELGIPVRPKDFDGLESIAEVLELCARKDGTA